MQGTVVDLPPPSATRVRAATVKIYQQTEQSKGQIIKAVRPYYWSPSATNALTGTFNQNAHVNERTTQQEFAQAEAGEQMTLT
eukprot:2505620-Amphidinium_carterae.1